ncbi:unnamed protein product [Discosporangium mesarthrocarpum]
MESAIAWTSDDVMKAMTVIVAGLLTLVGVQLSLLTPKRGGNGKGGLAGSTWLACPATNPAKRDWEVFNLLYGPVWIGCMAVIVAFSLYESFDEFVYLAVLVGLCIPIFAFPFVGELQPPEQGLPWSQRFAVRANLWIATYSFIGNYWYTHYFYSVLKASYSFPSWCLNGVPIPLYFATFFYFCFYHTLSNMAIRKVVTKYEAGIGRSFALITLVGTMAYTTAFMETLTISGFPYYSFEDRNMAYIVGSAFYGIYFIVSFPMFYALDEWPPLNPALGTGRSLWGVAVDSMGGCMLILTLLDLVRLVLGVELTIQG